MSSTDKRIVELEFDNKQFESGVSTSLKSLQNLDKSLDNIDGKSLSGLQNSLNGLSFSGIEDGVSSLNEKFGAMGTFFRSVISNIANDVYDLGKKIVSSTFGQILTGGSKRALNIEQAKFMFQGLGLDIEEAMKNANDAVLDTAYGLDEAAVVASQLAASGVQLGDDMTRALTAISGAAAMTGSDYIDLGRIFTTVAGNGRLMGDQLLQFSVRGLNLAADIGERYGMTEAEVRKAVSKGMISFEMFYETLYNKYADQAKKANETFNGALSNVKAALNRVGAEIMTPYYRYARDILNAIRPVINAFKTEMMPVFKYIEGKMSVVARGVQKFTDSLFDKKWNDVKGQLETILAAGPKKALDTLAEIIQNILKGIWNIGVNLKDVFGNIAKAFTNVFGQDILDKINSVAKMFAKVTTPVQETAEAVGKLKRGMQEGAGFGDKKVLSVGKAIYDLFTGIFNIIKSVTDVASNLSKVLSPIFKNILFPAGNFLVQTGVAVLSEISEKLAFITGYLRKFTDFEIFGTTIGNILEKVRIAITNFTDKSVDAIHWFFDNFNELPKWFIELWDSVKNFANEKAPGVIEFFKKLGDTFRGLFEDFKESDFFNKLINFFNRMIEKVREFVSGVKLTDILYAIAGAFIYFKDTLKDVYEFLSPIFDGFFDMMKHFADTVKDTIIGSLSDEAGKNLLSGGILATLIVLFQKLSSFLNGINLKGIKESVIGILEEFGGVLKSYQKTIDANNLWTLAKAIGILAVSIAALAMLDTEKVVQVSAVLMALGAGLAFFIKNFSKPKEAATIGDALKSFGDNVGAGIRSFLTNVGQALSQAIKLESIMLALDLFAFAILELVAALKIVSTIPWDNIGPSLAAMGACIVALGGVFISLKYLSDNMDGKEVGRLAGTAASFAIVAVSLSTSMLIFSGAIAAFAATYEKHSEGFKAGLIAIVAIMTTLTIAMKALQSTFADESALKLATYAGTLVLLSASVAILAVGLAELAGAFALLDLIRWQGLVKGMAVLVGTVEALAYAAKIMKGAYADVLALSVSVGIIAAAMYPLVGALELLMLVPVESLEKFIIIMATLVGSLVVSAAALSGAALVLSKAGVNLESFSKSVLMFGAGVGAFGAGILMLTESLGLLVLIGPRIEAAAVGLAKGLEAFIITIGQSSVAMDAALQNIIQRLIDNLLTGIKNAIGPTIKTLGELIVSALDNLSEYLPPIIDKLSNLIVEALNRLTDNIPQIVDAVFNFLDALFGEIGKHFGEFSVSSFIIANLIIGELVAMIVVLNAIKSQVPGALASIGAMALLLGTVVAAFAILSAIDMPTMLDTALSLTLVLSALSGAMLVASMIPIQGAVQGALGLMAFIGIIAGGTAIILGLLGIIGQFEKAKDHLQKGLDVFVMLGEALGKFAGAILEGIASSVMSIIENLGTSLSNFWYNIQPFINGMRSLDSSILESAKNLAEILLILGGAEIVSAIANWLGGSKDFDNMKETLVGFADTIIEFSNRISALSEDDIAKTKLASEASKYLAEFMATAPSSGGVWQKLAGEKDIDKFSASAIRWAAAVVTVKNILSGSGFEEADANQIGFAASAGKALAEFAKTIPSSGGAWQKLAGEKDIDKFSTSAIRWAAAVVTMKKTLEGVSFSEADVTLISYAADAGKELAAFSKTIPSSGGAWQLIAGGKDLNKFSEAVKAYGRALVDFKDQISGISETDAANIAMATDMGNKLAEMNNAIPTSGGLWTILAGGKSLASWGLQLAAYGSALGSFCDSIADADLSSDKISAAVTATSELAKLNDIIPENKGNFFEKLGSFFGLNSDTAGFATLMSDVGSGLSSFSNKIQNVKFASVSLAISEIQRIIDCLKGVDATLPSAAANFKASLETLAATGVQGFITKFSGSYSQVSTTITTFFDSIVKLLETYATPMQNQGAKYAKWIASGFKSQESTISTTVKTVIQSVVTYLNSMDLSFQKAGQQSAKKYADGLNSGISTIKNVLSEISKASSNGLNSLPSSMYSAGVDAITGFINGGYAMQNGVFWAYWSIGRLALEAAKLALDSSSPSKEFEQLGKDSDMGMVIGLNNFAYMVEDASTNVANSALSAVTSSISKITSLLDDELDTTPTITPVLDLSQIQNGVYGIDSILGGVDARMLGSVDGDIRSMNEISNAMYNDSKIIEAISSLENRLDSVATRMENLQVVLDTGTLVGETAPIMNDEFGNMDVLSQRGVM